MKVTVLAELIAKDLAARAPKGDTLRLVRQFVMDTDCEDIDTMISGPPPTTGDPRWDALIAGVTEDIAFHSRRPVPSWVKSSEPLAEWWFVTDFPALHATAFLETPPALARRGVFLRRASLVNV